VHALLQERWGGPIRLYDQQAWGRDVRVRDDFSWTDLYEALGRLVVASSSLEDAVRGAVLNMLPSADWRRTELVLDGLGTGQLRERCEKLAYLVLDGELRDDVVSWLRAVKDSTHRRAATISSTATGWAAPSSQTARSAPP
jgi:hypothetical protein